jgi:hypothetical protein
MQCMCSSTRNNFERLRQMQCTREMSIILYWLANQHGNSQCNLAISQQISRLAACLSAYGGGHTSRYMKKELRVEMDFTSNRDGERRTVHRN